MNLSDIKSVLDTISLVGIEEVVMEPSEKGTLIRGANKECNIIIYDDLSLQISELPLGIQSVRGLLSRIDLFDETKCELSSKDNKTVITDLLLKQGRKKASFKCAEPSHLTVPSMVPGNLDNGNHFVFSKKYIDDLNQAFAAMAFTGTKNERTVSIEVKDDETTISIYDGESDTFSDVLDVGENMVTLTGKFSWEVAPFQRVLKQAIGPNENNIEVASFVVTEHGIAIFEVGGLSIIVAPVS